MKNFVLRLKSHDQYVLHAAIMRGYYTPTDYTNDKRLAYVFDAELRRHSKMSKLLTDMIIEEV